MIKTVDNAHTHTIHTNIRTTEAYLYYKLTKEPKGSGELKSPLNIFIFRNEQLITLKLGIQHPVYEYYIYQVFSNCGLG